MPSKKDLSTPKLTKGAAASITIEPHHDRFTRWWIESCGELPTPEEVRKIKPAWERRGLHLPEAQYIENVRADLLAQGDPEGGIPPFDPAGEIRAAAKAGVDISKNPALHELSRLLDIGLRRQAARPKEKDPKAAVRAITSIREKELRKKKAKATKRTRKPVAKSRKRSKVLRRRPLRDEVRDRKIIKEVHGYLEVGMPVRLTASKGDLVIPPSLRPPTLKGRSTTYDHPIWLPHWEKATLPLRAMAMGIAAGAEGARDFTLHLGDSGIRYGMRSKNMQFARRLYRRIEDALKNKCPKEGFDPPGFAFFVEQGEGERPHLHGFIYVPSLKKQERELRKILRKAVGTDWKPSGNDRTQLELGNLYEPVGWINYITKFNEVTKDSLGGNNIFASSRRISRQGRQWYEHIRKSKGLLSPRKGTAKKPAATP